MSVVVLLFSSKYLYVKNNLYIIYFFFSRMPDDPNERTTYRNGRFINNIFVPNDQPVPEEVTVEIRQPKSFNFDDFYKGRRPQLPDNMAMESRNDNGVYVKPPADFQVYTRLDLVNVVVRAFLFTKLSLLIH